MDRDPIRTIFEYTDYREFLRDYYNHSKTQKKSFSFRLFARLCGFKSSNFLMLVMQGKSSLTSVSVEKVIKGIKFNSEESDFFRNLVGFNEAKTVEQRTHHAREMMKSRSFKKIFPLSEAQYRYLGTWYFPVLRSVVALKDFKNDIKWIAENLYPEISEEQVKKAIDELLLLGLLNKDENGNLLQTHGMVSTPHEVASIFAAQYHRQMLERASESIDRFKREQRHLIGATIELDDQSFVKLKEMAEKFRQDVMALAGQSPKGTGIFQINLQAFPLFKVPQNEKGKA